jgi:UDP-N-acetylglucosamine 2-epimerase (non-hydrolysing)
VRENTERPVTVESGTNVIAGTASQRISVAVQQQLLRRPGAFLPKNWDGNAATRIIDVLVKTHHKKSTSGHPTLLYS